MTKSYNAWIDDIHQLTVIMNDIESYVQQEKPPIIYWKKKQKHFHIQQLKLINNCTLQMTYDELLPIGEVLTLLWGNLKIPIYPREIVRTNWFEKHYTSENIQLGADYQKTATTFTVWAPTATSVKLSLNHHLLLMQRQANGVWKICIHGDWHGSSYHYEACINGKYVISNDPYAKAMLANSAEGVVIDLEKTNPIHFRTTERPQLDHLKDAIIYELHIRDATIHENSGVRNRGKFLGVTELGTTTPNGFTTGLSYFKNLGITHIQLLPINDFARVNEEKPDSSYNWGYDPLYFQVPEGSYSLQPTVPATRIHETKQMIQTFHQNGLSVILDVVFNHVFIMEESPFEKLVPGYYFRYHADGRLSNGTGVGNDLATERKMVRKFILDTVDFWLQEYQVDGFRFDLMGAMDIETMNLIHKRCLKEPVPIMLLGEGWHLHTALHANKLATSAQSNQLPGIRFFNDYFRDTLKGDLFNSRNTGYINGNGHFVERLPHLVTGSALKEYGFPFVDDIHQTINFVECHDNHTLWDRLQQTNHKDGEIERKRMHQLATGITLLSQGVPFIHAGQEWFRSKNGDGNSYISADHVNQLDWNQREIENENITFIQQLISLRKAYDVFRLQSKQEIRRRLHMLKTPDPVFGFSLFDRHAILAIYLNPTKNNYNIRFPSSGRWAIVLTNRTDQPFRKEVIGEFTTITAYELIIFKKAINDGI